MYYGGTNAVRFVTNGMTCILMPMGSSSPQRQEEQEVTA
jgi:hypothetical protein